MYYAHILRSQICKLLKFFMAIIETSNDIYCMCVDLVEDIPILVKYILYHIKWILPSISEEYELFCKLLLHF